ncbi:PaaX family transcriptional regulator C-terminal domain-containing protein [Jannaschia ovalis]|uniref:PaaX family transcriptional regulator C-terminal domain-containing protein n=1 Tax=Jannaschia ovalis TaxID=3038773 RepID=A0ABY8LFY8_9RHOB|nr:PaaX family transcriptional regulator C-terminal domain-containing protein [Jannaschia sp. GRR-S6-38]WGH80212.1 PaaX family transcriptional regulator C-terminal domain-containing protein [Jannaschia sp. GRR-S6-38]
MSRAALDLLRDRAAPRRVWSVLVTIFGDLAQGPGAGLDGATLRAIGAELEIRPEALRTALHRLRRDGWIESTRTGRTTTHALTPSARAESRAAGRRIYATDAPDACWLVLSPDGTEPRVHLSARGEGFALPVDRPPPDWLRAQSAPPELCDASRDLAQALRRAGPLLDPVALSPAQIAALRTVIVHDWRRILLRASDLPGWAFPPEWQGDACRAEVADLLARLPRPEIARISPR